MKITKIEKQFKPIVKLKVCAYVRVSTKDQKTSIKNQYDYWQNKLTKMKNAEFIKVYLDNGYSGTNQSCRNEFMKMITLAKKGGINKIYTKSISRFGRNFKETLEISRTLKNLDVEIIFEKEKISSCDLTNNLMFNIMLNIAEMESEIISSNVKWSCRENFKKGISNFHREFFGYRKTQDGKYIIDNEEATIVRELFKLSIEGYGQSRSKNIIENKYQRKISISGIDKILSSRKYLGEEVLQDYYIEKNKVKRNKGELDQYIIMNKYPPIINEEIWKLSTQKKRERYRGGNK